MRRIADTWRRYTAKALDDQSRLHALWLLFAVGQSIPLSARGRTPTRLA